VVHLLAGALFLLLLIGLMMLFEAILRSEGRAILAALAGTHRPARPAAQRVSPPRVRVRPVARPASYQA
jgi:hypothetical protein